MFKRLLNLNDEDDFSAFVFGPRGTGKTHWVKQHLPDAIYIDLLHTEIFNQLLAMPSRLESLIPVGHIGWVVIDEVQKVPALLDEVHRLIEHRGCQFVLTGSSARSLKRKGVNLLAGRALRYNMHPLTYDEVGSEFNFEQALQFGLLPKAVQAKQPKHYLSTYLTTYLQEEVKQEGLARNVSEFARFLETASFSQGSTLNMSEIAREAAIDRKTVASYFNILEDLLIAVRLPVFTKHAKRDMASHPKFFYFDVGVYRTIRPLGPLDSSKDIDGPALETLFLQHLRAYNDYYALDYEIYYWRTKSKQEVDFIMYGEHGFYAFEIKRTNKLKNSDFSGLKSFMADYPKAICYMVYGGTKEMSKGDIRVVPHTMMLKNFVVLCGVLFFNVILC